MTRYLVLAALVLAGCPNSGSGPTGVRGVASAKPSLGPSASPTATPGQADVSGTWVYTQAAQQQECVSSGLAISQAGPNLSIRVITTISYGSGQPLPPGAAPPADTGGFSGPIVAKLQGQDFAFDGEDGQHFQLKAVGDHLEGTRGTEAVKLYLHRDAMPQPCRVPRP